jgi:5-methylcytosine-specific restriction endonuclease McrA
MKIPVFHYAYDDSAVFTCRFRGLKHIFHCKRFAGKVARIRTAGALRIRSKVIPGWWKLNKASTAWTLYKTGSYFVTKELPKPIATVPAHEVIFAYGFSSRCADFETYGAGNAIHWQILKTEVECESGISLFELTKGSSRTHCPDCVKRMKPLMTSLSDEEYDDWLHPERVSIAENRTASESARWVRKFAAESNFTKAELKELCTYYANRCLCCGASAPLVADHVIPLSRGGDHDITNIQPLCKPCNNRKGTRNTDYRRNRQTQSKM